MQTGVFLRGMLQCVICQVLIAGDEKGAAGRMRLCREGGPGGIRSSWRSLSEDLLAQLTLKSGSLVLPGRLGFTDLRLGLGRSQSPFRDETREVGLIKDFQVSAFVVVPDHAGCRGLLGGKSNPKGVGAEPAVCGSVIWLGYRHGNQRGICGGAFIV